MENGPNSPPASFDSVEAAWFWTVRALRAPPIRLVGSDEPTRRRTDDVIKCLDTLYRNRRIELLHVRIMRIWGLRGVAPNPTRARERSDWRIWREAMDRLDAALRTRGIVAEAPVFHDAAD